MRRATLARFVLGLGLLGSCGRESVPATARVSEAAPPEEDAAARDLSALEFEHWIGAPVPLAPGQGRATLVRWWTDTCPFCEASLPAIEALRTELGPEGLNVVAAYHPKPPRQVAEAAIREAALERGYRGPIAVDPDWSALERAWPAREGRRATSVTLLLDGAGRVRFAHPGPELHLPGTFEDRASHGAATRDFEALRRAARSLVSGE